MPTQYPHIHPYKMVSNTQPKDVDERRTGVLSVGWDTSPVAAEDERKVVDILEGIPGYHRLDASEMERLAQMADEMGMTLRQVTGLRSGLLRQQAMSNHQKAVDLAPRLSKEYDGSASVMDLALAFDLPPGTVMRMVLRGRGWTKDRVRVVLNKKPQSLNSRDSTEWKLARENDMITAGNDAARSRVGAGFEQDVAEHFDRLGVTYRTQEELFEEQVLEFGRPMRTPDILFDEPVLINGQEIAWVDAKAFYGANIWSNRKSFQKQTNRYHPTWGQGALLFKHSFCDDLQINGAVLLDSSPMDDSYSRKGVA